MKRVVFLVAVVMLTGLPASVMGQPKSYAIRVGKLYPVTSEPIDDAVMIVVDGKIDQIGPAKNVRIPEGIKVQHFPEAHLIPGLVDTHSHIGIYPRPHVQANSDGNEMTGPIQTGLRALDAIDPNDPGIRMALAGGITTANIMPGSGNAIGGQTLYVKLRGGSIEQMQIIEPKTLGGLKMANGENPKGYGRRNQAPFTRMKIAALQREQFVRARDYKARWDEYHKAVLSGKKATEPERDINLEPLVEVLQKKRTVHFHCHRADDLITAIRIAEEFDFEIVLQHATEGYRVVEMLAKKKIPVSLTLVDSPGGKAETMGLLEENAAILDKAGVNVALNTDDFITESRFFLRTGSIAVRGGMSEEAALKSLTINPARMMHLDHRIGSLEKGKEADFVLLSGAPFSIYTQVLQTFIEGEKVFDRSVLRDWSYQVGGFGLPDLRRLPSIFAPLRGPKSVRMPEGEFRPMESYLARVQVIRAGRIHLVSGPPIENGVILIEDGKIKAIGKEGEIAIPKGAVILTAAEVTPGLIDTHSVCGLSGALNIPADQDQDELSDPNQADLRVIDGFNPNEPLLEFFRREGVTIIHAMPGRMNVIGGQTGIFRTFGPTLDKATIRFPAAVLVNLGESPKDAYRSKGPPATRMATAKIIREALTGSQQYAARLRDPEASQKLTRNLKAEGLIPLVKGDIPLIISAHRADDISTGLRLAKEFKLKAMLSLASEGYLITDAIADAKVPVIVHPSMQRIGANLETMNTLTINAAILAEKKIPVSISTAFEGYVPKTRVLRAEMAMAATHGLGTERALRAVTLDAAKILGIDQQYGSIEVGKVADLVLYDGDPFENATHVKYTIMEGRIVYDRLDYLKLPFERRAIPLHGSGIGCCLGQW